MRYEVIISKSVRKTIKRLPVATTSRIWDSIDALEMNPRPHGAIKLQGIAAYRIRVGDFRIIYEIHDKQLIVVVAEVGNRRDIYR